jgi:hypothetical protein
VALTGVGRSIAIRRRLVFLTAPRAAAAAMFHVKR